MPLYEFACPRCGEEFEEILPPQRADAPMACPSCGKKAQRKLSSFTARSGSPRGRQGGCGPGRGRIG